MTTATLFATITLPGSVISHAEHYPYLPVPAFLQLDPKEKWNMRMYASDPTSPWLLGGCQSYVDSKAEIILWLITEQDKAQIISRIQLGYIVDMWEYAWVAPTPTFLQRTGYGTLTKTHVHEWTNEEWQHHEYKGYLLGHIGHEIFTYNHDNSITGVTTSAGRTFTINVDYGYIVLDSLFERGDGVLMCYVQIEDGTKKPVKLNNVVCS